MKMLPLFLISIMINITNLSSSDFLKYPPMLVGDKFGFTEGPVWINDKEIFLFSDIPNNKIYSVNLQGQVNVFDNNSGYANGLAVTEEGTIFYARHDRNISKRNFESKSEIIASHFKNKRLNSPNDLVISKDGSIWFTDPPFGIQGYGPEKAEEEQPVRGVYQIKGKEIILRDDSFNLPNGIAFSPDESFIYVADTADGTVYRFENKNGKLSNKEAFAKLESGNQNPIVDGIAVDEYGNLYITGRGGIGIFSQSGKQLDFISIDSNHISNIGIGGKKNNMLMVTAVNKVLIFEIK